ncbi:putative uncharacterized protein DDB_G0282133 isoform X2 [Paramacrobiotus metropolitanus]|uniref:putative uncharacterized protein DDB_G0282133 isoform X2 n=1 Tax=Paramacrobiotus metropolitanus TaxID=2943436 RepID=UPI0024459E95|nr:putative uncharacterized protein DDB_G0282133 isoform X2 [Paramacrobiotus metropolitanus]
MASLGANITIPDQVVLVGGTGRHLSERFAIISENLDRFGPGHVSNGYNNSPPKNIQERLGPRRFTGNDYNLQNDSLYSMQPSRPHVLKRLGQPANNYNNWGGQNYTSASQNDMVNGSAYNNERSSYNTYNPGQVGRGRGRRRWFGYGGYRGGYNRYYAPYSYYNSYSSPYSYYGSYSKPRFGNYTKYYGSSYTSFRKGNNGYGGSRYNRGRRGRNAARNAGRPQMTQEDLDRELDEYRSGNVAKEERSSDVNMS